MCVQPVQTFLCPRTLRLWEERYLYNETCLKCSDNTLSLSFPKAVREEQKALPWPFIRSTAVPQSPPLAASSPYSRSLSVGSSPNRTPRPQPHIPPHLADNYRTKRTRYAPSRACSPLTFSNRNGLWIHSSLRIDYCIWWRISAAWLWVYTG